MYLNMKFFGSNNDFLHNVKSSDSIDVVVAGVFRGTQSETPWLCIVKTFSKTFFIATWKLSCLRPIAAILLQKEFYTHKYKLKYKHCGFMFMVIPENLPCKQFLSYYYLLTRSGEPHLAYR